MHLLLDVDGVLCDFVNQTCEVHGHPIESVDSWDYFKNWGLTAEEFWNPLRGRELWANMSPYPWAHRLYHSLTSRFEVTFATSPSKDACCPSGKVDWLWKHFGEGNMKYMIGPQKLLMAKPGHLLIDDNAETCENFRKHDAHGNPGGDAILFPQPWNTPYDQIPEDPAAYVLEQVDAWASRMGVADEAAIEVHQ